MALKKYSHGVTLSFVVTLLLTLVLVYFLYQASCKTVELFANPPTPFPTATQLDELIGSLTRAKNDADVKATKEENEAVSLNKRAAQQADIASKNPHASAAAARAAEMASKATKEATDARAKATKAAADLDAAKAAKAAKAAQGVAAPVTAPVAAPVARPVPASHAPATAVVAPTAVPAPTLPLNAVIPPIIHTQLPPVQMPAALLAGPGAGAPGAPGAPGGVPLAPIHPDVMAHMQRPTLEQCRAYYNCSISGVMI
jgi:hypothetical protein